MGKRKLLDPSDYQGPAALELIFERADQFLKTHTDEKLEEDVKRTRGVLPWEEHAYQSVNHNYIRHANMFMEARDKYYKPLQKYVDQKSQYSKILQQRIDGARKALHAFCDRRRNWLILIENHVHDRWGNSRTCAMTGVAPDIAQQYTYYKSKTLDELMKV